jgi:hypothetical protein
VTGVKKRDTRRGAWARWCAIDFTFARVIDTCALTTLSSYPLFSERTVHGLRFLQLHVAPGTTLRQSPGNHDCDPHLAPVRDQSAQCLCSRLA